jgi:hypothetical protein
MPAKKIKTKSNVPEAEKQSTLVLAHLGALEPVLGQLPAQMGLELKEALIRCRDLLDKVLRTKVRRMNCFLCDGTGLMCAVCGESEAACECDRSEPTPCGDCKGVGQVIVPLKGC